MKNNLKVANFGNYAEVKLNTKPLRLCGENYNRRGAKFAKKKNQNATSLRSRRLCGENLNCIEEKPPQSRKVRKVKSEALKQLSTSSVLRVKKI